MSRVFNDIYSELKDLIPKSPKFTAVDFLNKASFTLSERARLRDKEDTGERSMSACVEAYNALTGCKMTVLQGWIFMLCLKLSRAKHGKYHPDDYTDLIGYAALAAEEANERAEERKENNTNIYIKEESNIAASRATQEILEALQSQDKPDTTNKSTRKKGTRSSK